jgi:hypothetical protein
MRKSEKKMLGVSKNGMHATVGIMFFEMPHQQWKEKHMLFKVLPDYTRKSMQVFTKILPYLDNRFQQVAKI